jgi:Putative peptidoglycan binding domain
MKRVVKFGACAVVLTTAMVGAFVITRSSTDSTASAATEVATKQTVKVVRRDLVTTTSITGTVTYGASTAVRLTGISTGNSSSTSAATSTGNSTPGGGANAAATTATTASTPAEIVTALPALGKVITRGAPLYEVNGAVGPVLLFGARPAWRDLSTASENGVDILQLEENLSAMGFTHSGALVVDDDFTSSTASAVRDWQEALGVDETGTVAASDIWFGPGDVRVASITGALGDSASSSVMTVTGTQQLIHVDLDVANVAYVKEGQTLDVTLADDSVVSGKVVALSKAAVTSTSTGGGGGGGGATTTTTTVSLDIKLDAQAKNVVEATEVSIELVTSSVDNALSVPTSALLALAEGGYALELSDGKLVGVTPGKYADGFVEISGDIAEGDAVVAA